MEEWREGRCVGPGFVFETGFDFRVCEEYLHNDRQT